MSFNKSIPFQNVKIQSGFWFDKQKMNREVTLDSVRTQFEKTGRFDAFRCDWQEGQPNKPHVFWDSDVAKWLESAAYILSETPDAALESNVEEIIDRIEKNQTDDGYFNVYYTAVEPGNRFTVRNNHELYCAGHLMEAAVAYFEATGKDRFLKIMCRYADLIERVFKTEQSAVFATPGHEEIELALLRLYLCTKEKRYLDLALFFLDTRGTDPEKDDMGIFDRSYFQDHLPVRQQRTAEGHAVRACYLYCAMADAAMLTGDEKLKAACEALFESIRCKRMYITGGIGSTHKGERFTGDFHLPNATAYAETCAAIALSMFASRMSRLSPKSKYADVVETALFNGILSGISLDGKSFFYENPLEINLSDRKAEKNLDIHRALTQRVEVFSCSCCPPNMTRFLSSLSGLFFSYDDNSVFVHQYASCTACVPGGGEIRMDTAYPSDGVVHFSVSSLSGKAVAVRIPGWCTNFTLSADHEVRDGYAYIPVSSDNFTFTLNLQMKPAFFEASPRVSADAGKVALQKGPVVYCLEGVDNENDLNGLCADIFESAEESVDDETGIPTLTLRGFRKFACGCCNETLYRPVNGDYRPTKLRFIPYYAFANRGETDMKVWVTKF